MDQGSARNGRAPTVLIADDHVATRIGLRTALEDDGFCVVAEVDAADDAVAAALAIENGPRP